MNADKNRQDPTNTQCYNKYGYVMNNLLIVNDPSGEVIPLLIAAGIAATIALFSYTAITYLKDGVKYYIGSALKAAS
ncbi:hypothetical protein [Flavobacterium columnare]|uniref:hypothetical protein n=2 Tax=Flavobacterium columnare TaxID=996 RepID=UPI00177B04B0|nr:hypothetical protein [Flavobacterium columnare]AUX18043.1 hypothetical protein AQ623_07025 [Flavobacterium columnare]QOG59835.1 hypothetical protein HUE30_06950 [Flavobacterium columnare]